MDTDQTGVNAAQVCMHAVGVSTKTQPFSNIQYDESTQTLLTEFNYTVLSKPLYPNSRQSAWEVQLGDGDPVTAMHTSLDGFILAVQRSSAFVQFVHVQSSKIFVQAPKNKAPLLNFFWCPSTACDFVMATAQGLELYRRLPTNQGLHYMGSKKHPTAWCMYSHEARIALLAWADGGLWVQVHSQLGVCIAMRHSIALLAGADGGLWVQAYQFSNDAVLKLPPFQLQPPLPPQVAPKPGQAQQLLASSIRILTVYGRVYCAHLDYRQQHLSLYRFYKDAVTLQHTYDIFSQQIELSVHDNVLLVHQLESSTVMVLDLRAPTTGPISSPLPLHVARQQDRVRLPGGAPTAAEAAAKDQLEKEGRLNVAGEAAQPSASTSGRGNEQGHCLAPEHLDSKHWRFQQPNLILNTETGQVWQCQIDIAGIARTCSDCPLLLGFLQRRQQALHPGCDIKAMLLSIVKSALLEQQGIATIQSMFNVLASGFAEAYAQRPRSTAWISVSPNSRGKAAKLSMPVLTPQEVEVKVLRWLHEEEATGVQYLEAALAAYLDSCARHGVEVPSGLHLLALDVALLTSHSHQVGMMLRQAAPAWDSAIMASHIEHLARKGTFPEGWHGALDMYARLGMHDRHCHMLLSKVSELIACKLVMHNRYCHLLLSKGLVVQALAYAQKHKVTTIKIEAYVSKAAETGDFLAHEAVCRAVRPGQSIENHQAMLEHYRSQLLTQTAA